MLQKLVSNIFYFIFKIILGVYIIIFQGVRFRKNKFKVPKGPVLFLSNHQSDWDGIYLNIMFIDKNIHFLAHDELFKNKFYRAISSYCLQFIKRGNSKSDVTAIRTLLKARDEKKSIGIYPEGDIDFFGDMMYIAPSIAKLVRKLNMNVVLLTISGASLRAPRWGKYPHRSKVRYQINDVIEARTLDNMNNYDLYYRILEGISHNESSYQKREKIKLLGRNRAEWLELALYVCPKCNSIGSLHSHMNNLICSNCDFKTTYTKYAVFQYEGKKYFENTSQWNLFQKEYLSSYLINFKGEIPIFVSENILYQYTELGNYFSSIVTNCRLSLFKDFLRVEEYETGNIINYYFDKILNVRIQYKATLEFEYDDNRIRFFTDDYIWSALLWKDSILILKEKH